MAAPLPLVLPAIFVGAALYTSVGHGGATVYLAILTLANFALGPLSTTVLVLNVLAASVAFVMFRQAGHLRWPLLWPFLVTSVPAAFLGGFVPLNSRAQELILGAALLAAAIRFLAFRNPPHVEFVRRDSPAFFGAALVLGAVLGFLAGVTGIGGGIFLSPILFAAGWANLREASAIASAFIVLNSLAGLAAKVQRIPLDFGLLVPLAVVVSLGALVGAFAGARKLPPRAMQVLLGCVLLVAAVKTAL